MHKHEKQKERKKYQYSKTLLENNVNHVQQTQTQKEVLTILLSAVFLIVFPDGRNIGRVMNLRAILKLFE